MQHHKTRARRSIVLALLMGSAFILAAPAGVATDACAQATATAEAALLQIDETGTRALVDAILADYARACGTPIDTTTDSNGIEFTAAACSGSGTGTLTTSIVAASRNVSLEEPAAGTWSTIPKINADGAANGITAARGLGVIRPAHVPAGVTGNGDATAGACERVPIQADFCALLEVSASDWTIDCEEANPRFAVVSCSGSGWAKVRVGGVTVYSEASLTNPLCGNAVGVATD